MDVADLLRTMAERGASDLHLSAGNVPFIRVDGELLPMAFAQLDADDTEDAAEALMPAHKRSEFTRTNEADFAYSLEGVGRFRVNVLRQRGTVALAIRLVASEGQTFEELNLPPIVQSLAEARRGLVLVTGPTGAGKTTTIAAMIGFINRTRRAHIVTIEDPIEVVHTDDMSVVWQREIGPDTESYAAALRQVLRQDPDVIFVGEIRDADETVSRVVELFPQSQHQQVRTSLAGALRGIVSQRLLERADGRGLIPAVEVLINTGRIYERILDADATAGLVEVIAESSFDGMQTFDQDLVRLVRQGLVVEEDARAVATNPHDFTLALGGALARAAAEGA
jgi:twitching motility protein PilT